ncbi:MAG: ABC transporter ATP-binding protein [Candidatus Caldarchaeum sp.]|nr:ABC transporter ATP-binding protein [Candidatus Caldarchaeum sp.]
MTALLEVHNLRVKISSQEVIRNISFQVEEGEIFGLVGESGAGKSMTGRAIIRLLPPNAVTYGRIIFKGVDLLSINENQMRMIRGKDITLIQQDPVASLNPAFKIRDQLLDIMKLHLKVNGEEAENRAVSLLKEVGISSPETVLRKYPHQLSGGMCQRVMIAVAFACAPSLVIADEPTTALDVITQAMVVRLMKRMKEHFNTAIIFITHNLALAVNTCNRIAVMNKGTIVEVLEAGKLFQEAQHEYTKMLLASIPSLRSGTMGA